MPHKCKSCEEDITPSESRGKDEVIQIGLGHFTTGEYSDFVLRESKCYFHLNCFKGVTSPTPKDILFQVGWEDSECARIETLACSCGRDLLKDYGEFTASHEEIIDCPKCGKKYQFIWEGMTIKEVA